MHAETAECIKATSQLCNTGWPTALHSSQAERYLEDVVLAREWEVSPCDVESDLGKVGNLSAVQHSLA
jgi:hypothetical protein